MLQEKTCINCKIPKPFTKFWKSKTCKDGYRNKCLDCYADDKKLYRAKNKDILKVKKSAYYFKNKDKIIRNEDPILKKERSARYWQKHKEKLRLKTKEYKKNNPEKVLAWSSKRRSQEINAIPRWLTKEHFKEIEYFYKLAKTKEAKENIKYHVDHIIPLLGKNVCGLHVPWNLQLLKAEDNLHKGNKYEN